MKYSQSVEINLPLARVIELFDDPRHYTSWQKSLVSIERIEGEHGQVGARTRLEHKMGGRAITMIETITESNLPDVLKATYEAPGVWNQNLSQFIALNSEKTRWMMDSEFKASGLMGIMTRFMPAMFKKQTLATMKSFKMFAENQGA